MQPIMWADTSVALSRFWEGAPAVGQRNIHQPIRGFVDIIPHFHQWTLNARKCRKVSEIVLIETAWRTFHLLFFFF